MLKDFDRHIEQLMNESSVTPPFGAWNRIAAELDAAPIANPTTGSAAGSVAQPLLNAGTVFGFISGALLIGTAVTGWLLYNNYNNNPASTIPPVNTTTHTEEVITTPTQTATTEIIAQKPVEVKTTRITTGVTKTTNVVTPKTTPIPQNNEEVAAPTIKLPMDKEKNVNETYYFPPVDINTGNETLQNTAPVFENDKKHDEADEAKITKRVSQSSSSGERIKFKKKRKTNWTYGRLNRTKNKSKY